MSANYRATGYRRPKLRASANAGALTSTFIDAPGAGKQILIWDIVVEGGSEFIREGDYNSGTLIVKVTEGHTGFVAPLALAENKGLTVDSSGGTTHQIMVHYSIEDV